MDGEREKEEKAMAASRRRAGSSLHPKVLRLAVSFSLNLAISGFRERREEGGEEKAVGPLKEWVGRLLKYYP